MDPITWAIIGGIVIIAIAATLYALNRSWGDFPKDARYQPRSGASAPGSSRAPEAPAELPADPSGSPDTLVPIEHQLVRRSAEQALQRGSAAARYIVRRDDRLYFDFSRIDDPNKRREAADMMRRFNQGKDIDIRAMMRMVQELFNP